MKNLEMEKLSLVPGDIVQLDSRPNWIGVISRIWESTWADQSNSIGKVCNIHVIRDSKFNLQRKMFVRHDIDLNDIKLLKKTGRIVSGGIPPYNSNWLDIIEELKNKDYKL